MNQPAGVSAGSSLPPSSSVAPPLFPPPPEISPPTWPALLGALLTGEQLSRDQTAWAMGQIISGDATPAQLAGFVVALRAKGETAEEVLGMVEVLLAHAATISVTDDTVDVVGTGGDGAHTVNISTMAAIVVAGMGIRVAKHGGRSASSRCGAADLLEELGVPLDLTPERVAACVTEAGIGFCFAQRLHPGMRHAAPVRAQLAIPTVFNYLGPLANPARPRAAAVGCADRPMAGVMAGVMADRGVTALVMRGEDGLDEFTTTAPTRLWVVEGPSVRECVVDAVDFGLPRATTEDLRGGDPAENAAAARAVLAGERGTIRDAVLVNAAAAYAAYQGFPGGVEQALLTGIARAAEAIDSGTAAATLERWIAVATR